MATPASAHHPTHGIEDFIECVVQPRAPDGTNVFGVIIGSGIASDDDVGVGFDTEKFPDIVRFLVRASGGVVIDIQCIHRIILDP